MRQIRFEDARASLLAASTPAFAGWSIPNPAQAADLGRLAARPSTIRTSTIRTSTTRTSTTTYPLALIDSAAATKLPAIAYKIEKFSYDNSMATMHLAADARIVPAMCDRMVSTATAQISINQISVNQISVNQISIDKGAGVDAHGIPPRGAPG